MILININAEKIKDIEKKHYEYTKELICDKINRKLKEIEDNCSDEFGKSFVEFLKELLDTPDSLLKKIILMDKENLLNFPISIENDCSFDFINKYLDLQCKIKKCEDEINKYENEIPYFRKNDMNTGRLNKIENLCELIQKFALDNNSYFEKSGKYKNKGEFKKDLNDLKIRITDKDNKKIALVKKYLLEIFDYDSFVKETDKWSAYFLASYLDINVCPYCNRSYVNTIISKTGKARPELDHFYPKSIYPFFALTLYNLIPSCHICNFKKGQKDTVKERILYPYSEQFGKGVKFTARLYNEKDLNVKNKLPEKDLHDIKFFFGNSNNFKIEIDETNEKIKNCKETFLLEDFYQFHKKDVRKIIKKAIVYTSSRIDELYNNYCPDLFESREEIVQMIFSNYDDEENLNTEILSKLTKDICDDLDINTK
ncbi:UNVERIFIED_CONTAM: hypothetical protein Cloal_2348 [Acetivibrio alkalicellulosi]